MMKLICRYRFRFLCGLVALVALSTGAVARWGCKTMEGVTQVGTSVGVNTGVISSAHADSITKSVSAVSRTFEDITPEQEYYLGRAVAAVIAGKYRLYNDQPANLYINKIGQTLALASDRPETFGGYHFMILDSDEINAFAAPGGLVFVSRGLLRCAISEDQVAAVLAHEVAHVQERHALKSINNSRLTTALSVIALEGAKTYSGGNLSDLVTAFEGSITDMTQTLFTNGYSRTTELEADAAALTILRRVGYDPNALVQTLGRMGQRLSPGGLDFAKTHPSPASRIEQIKGQVESAPQVKPSAARQARYALALGQI
ncbi:MAG: M48 family metalloprotease [Deltaproteobacteria bacterium]|nr:M48 family metalloprotease [Deltaproteobacteria bacterium]